MLSRRSTLSLASLSVMASASVRAEPSGSGRLFVVRHVEVAAASAGQIAEALRRAALESRPEAGEVWSAMLQEVGRPDRFAVVEAWEDPRAFDAHRESASAKDVDRALERARVSPVDDRVHSMLSGRLPPNPLERGAVVVLTHVDVNSAAKDQGTAYLRDVVDLIGSSDGAVGVVLLQQDSRPNHSTLVEVWRDQQALEAHAAAAGTVQFRQRLQPLLGGLYDERRYPLL